MKGKLMCGAPRMLVACGIALLAGVLFLAVPADADPPGFDHFRTRFPLVGAHERITCQSCHQGGLFEGTPTRCVLCHDGSGFRARCRRWCA